MRLAELRAIVKDSLNFGEPGLEVLSLSLVLLRHEDHFCLSQQESTRYSNCMFVISHFLFRAHGIPVHKENAFPRAGSSFLVCYADSNCIKYRCTTYPLASNAAEEWQAVHRVVSSASTISSTPQPLNMLPTFRVPALSTVSRSLSRTFANLSWYKNSTTNSLI